MFIDLISKTESLKATAKDCSKVTYLRSFIESYGSMVGSHPFLHGLRQYFTVQRISECCLDWQIQDGLFIESGGAKFCTDAVTLCHNLELYPSTECVVNTSGVVVRNWMLQASVSNKQLKILLAALPKRFETHFHGILLANEKFPRLVNDDKLDDGETALVEPLSVWSRITSYCIIL